MQHISEEIRKYIRESYIWGKHRSISGIRGGCLGSSGTFLPITSVYIQRGEKIYSRVIYGENIGMYLWDM